MSKVSFIYRTDVHLSDKNPPSWKGDYQAELWSSLEEIGQFAKQYEVDAVLDGGDYFHIKSPIRNSHFFNTQSTKIHQQYPCPTYHIIGNHDITYNNLESLERQPLGVLLSSYVFHRLDNNVFRKGEVRVRVVGVPYNLKMDLDTLLSIQKQPEDTYLVAVVHMLASENPPPKVEDFFGEPVFRYRDLITPGGPDVWAFGHWHRDQGITKIDGKYFVNQGAVSRGALIHENVKRTPQVALLVFDEGGINIRTLPLSVAPAEDVFDFEKKERTESEVRSIDHFVSKLQEDASFDTEATIEENIRSLDFAAEVRDMALLYLERARNEGN